MPRAEFKILPAHQANSADARADPDGEADFSPVERELFPGPGRALGGGLPFELELLDAVPDLVAIQAEERRRAGLVPAAPFERLHDERPLQLLDVDARRREFHAVGET